MRFHRASLLCILLMAALLGGFAGPPHAQAQPSANLVANGDFESGSLARWETCGGVRLADRQAGAGPLEVYGGRYALRLGNPSNDSCGDTLDPQLQADYPNIRVPADASGLTLGFWYSRVGSFGNNSAFWDLAVVLVTVDGGAQVRILEYIDADTTAGWNQARWELPPNEVAAARGRTFRLSFSLLFSLAPTNDLAYHIDDLYVTPATVRTPLAASPPPALADTNTRPLLGLAGVGGELQTVRADLNGGDIEPLYRGSQGLGAYRVRWSSDGQRFAALDQFLQPEPNEQPSVNWAQVSSISLFNADGSGRREFMRTTGKKLVPGSPPGCRAPRIDCVRYDDPALDVVIADLDWSPSGDRMAVNICSTRRYADGFSEDPLCRLHIYNMANNALLGEIKPALGVSWSQTNRLLYRVGLDGPLLHGIPQGIYEADAGAEPSAGRLLFAHRLPIDEDVGATWAPDGRRFVTLRYVEGNHYNTEGEREFSSALMLWDREAPSTPRQLVLVDWGRSIATPTWSPDGAYILFSVEGTAGWETYWLDVATGAAGLLTGDVVFAEWRPRGDAGVGLTRRVFVPNAARR